MPIDHHIPTEDVRLAVDLANTHPGISDAGEVLSGPAWIDSFAHEHGLDAGTEPIPPARQSDVVRLRALRDDLVGIFNSSSDAESVERLTPILSELSVRPVIVECGGNRRRVAWRGTGDGAFSQIAARIGTALATLATVGELDRIGECSRETCHWFYADFTKNRSKKFCDGNNCAGRTHTAAYRRRKSASKS